jgi:hypothetical protein
MAAVVKTAMMAAGIVHAPTALIVPTSIAVEITLAMPELAPVVLGTIKFFPVFLVPAAMLATVHARMGVAAVSVSCHYADGGYEQAASQ